MKKISIILLIVTIVIISLLIYIYTSKENIWESNKEVITDFEIIFNESKNSGKKRIVSKNIFIIDSYNVYSYDGNVKIKTGGIEYDFKEALLQDKIKIEDILYKAQEDAKNRMAISVAWDDGGTVIYKYETYSIIKFNKIGGNKDFYIGSPDMNYSAGE